MSQELQMVLEESLPIFAVFQRYFVTRANCFKMEESPPRGLFFVVNTLHGDNIHLGWFFAPWKTKTIILPQKRYNSWSILMDVPLGVLHGSGWDATNYFKGYRICFNCYAPTKKRQVQHYGLVILSSGGLQCSNTQVFSPSSILRPVMRLIMSVHLKWFIFRRIGGTI